jgi:hypothetical protein
MSESERQAARLFLAALAKEEALRRPRGITLPRRGRNGYSNAARRILIALLATN